MTKSKIKLAVVGFALLTFLVSVFYVYSLVRVETSTNISNDVHNRMGNMSEYIHRAKNIENVEFNFSSMNEGALCPCNYVLINENGEVIADSNLSITVDYQKNNELIGSYVLKIGDTLTEEQLKELEEAYKNCHYYINFIQSVSFYFDGKCYVPTEFTYHTGLNSDTDETVTLTLSTKKASFTADYNEGSCISLSGFSAYSSVLSEEYERSNRNVNSFADSFMTTHSSPNVWTGGGGVYGGNFIQNEEHFEVNGVKYCFYYEADADIAAETLKSENFILVVSFLFVLFAGISVVFYKILIRLYRKNEKLEESRRAFISAAAHELKTPLAVIGNNCECVLENVNPEKSTYYINTVYNESKRMGKMVKNLLEYNRVNTSAERNKEKVKLCEVIAEERENIISICESKNIDVSVVCDETLEMKCDKAQIALVLGNFLSNAVKFTPQGGKIEITAKKEHGKCRVAVYNSGSRVAEEDKPHIWEELYSGDKVRNRESDSTGMGLAVSRVILENHKFTYGFQNEENGVAFWFHE